jgi:formylmethanofuran dehydrogenase subunit C
VFLGKRQHRLEDFFAVEGAASDEVEIRGDLNKVKWMARGMSRGRVTIVGDAGMHLGAFMKGGSIHVTGSVSDWLGAEMTGGLIRVRGNAGGQVGAAYRGSASGMNQGTVLIEGSAGIEVGMRMKRGIIAVGGAVRDFAGLQMKGGTIFLLGGAEIRTGAWMARGTIVSLVPLKLLPTFAYSCSYQPSFLSVYTKHLQGLGFSIPPVNGDGRFDRYMGDTSGLGKGEILIWQASAAA